MNPFQQLIDAMKPRHTAGQLQGVSDPELADWYFEVIETPTEGPSIEVVMAEAEIARRGRSPDELLMRHSSKPSLQSSTQSKDLCCWIHLVKRDACLRANDRCPKDSGHWRAHVKCVLLA